MLFRSGAQYFTVRDARLSPLISSWRQRGLITPWQGALAVRDNGEWQPAKAGVRRWVAIPGMNSLGAHLADGLEVQLSTHVAHVQREGRQWRLVADSGADLGVFDSVLTCVPSPQAVALLAPSAPQLARAAASAVMQPTWATMVVLAERPRFEWDGAFLNDDDVLSWISRNASKPERAADETWVLHATRQWSTSHLEDDATQVAGEMIAAFATAVGSRLISVHSVAHRWRYALPDPVTSDAALYDATLLLGAGGDWCGGPRIEGALLSGIALAGRVMTHAHVAPV